MCIRSLTFSKPRKSALRRAYWQKTLLIAHKYWASISTGKTWNSYRCLMWKLYTFIMLPITTEKMQGNKLQFNIFVCRIYCFVKTAFLKGFLWTLAAFSLMFSPVFAPDHFRLMFICLLSPLTQIYELYKHKLKG